MKTHKEFIKEVEEASSLPARTKQALSEDVESELNEEGDNGN